ncbi:MAG: permease-like cell division protein FtsX [Melioribacteraceae bacterium]|nr:permease-like cell division protein FtsX [Melioribacteraceae bacterium]MCF8355436.1 permease-like cell division protein FtsX [Melioribacteraceae bacterium]MCF8420464.1 permease-like cell division protein FtsX [Melioribacteraceae bacterium]
MIGFYISEAFNSLKKTRFSTFFSVLTTSIAITLIVIVLAALILSQKIEKKLKSNVEITVFINDELPGTELEKLKNSIEQMSFVKKISSIDKNEAKIEFKKLTGNDFDDVLVDNPLPRSLKINLNENSISSQSLQQIRAELNSLKGIDEILFDYEIFLQILKYINIGKLALFIFSLIFTVLSIYLIYTTNRLISNQNVDLYKTMKLVGSTLANIKIPMLFSGILIGFISGMICVLGYNTSIYLLHKFMRINNFESSLEIINFIILFLGFLFGISGSIISIRNISLKIEKF